MNYAIHPALASKTRDGIIKHFTDNLDGYTKLAKNIAGTDSEDLFQACALMLMEFEEERLISYWNDKEGLKPIFIRILLNQYKSDTSRFHKDYRKQDLTFRNKAADIILNAPQSYESPETDYLLQINKACEDHYKQNSNRIIADLERMIWDLYIKTGSLRKALAAIDVQYSSLFDLHSVHVIVRKIQRTIKKYLSSQD